MGKVLMILVRMSRIISPKFNRQCEGSMRRSLVFCLISGLMITRVRWLLMICWILTVILRWRGDCRWRNRGRRWWARLSKEWTNTDWKWNKWTMPVLCHLDRLVSSWNHCQGLWKLEVKSSVAQVHPRVWSPDRVGKVAHKAALLVVVLVKETCLLVSATTLSNGTMKTKIKSFMKCLIIVKNR